MYTSHRQQTSFPNEKAQLAHKALMDTEDLLLQTRHAMQASRDKLQIITEQHDQANKDYQQAVTQRETTQQRA